MPRLGKPKKEEKLKLSALFDQIVSEIDDALGETDREQKSASKDR